MFIGFGVTVAIIVSQLGFTENENSHFKNENKTLFFVK